MKHIKSIFRGISILFSSIGGLSFESSLSRFFSVLNFCFFFFIAESFWFLASNVFQLFESNLSIPVELILGLLFLWWRIITTANSINAAKTNPREPRRYTPRPSTSATVGLSDCEKSEVMKWSKYLPYKVKLNKYLILRNCYGKFFSFQLPFDRWKDWLEWETV